MGNFPTVQVPLQGRVSDDRYGLECHYHIIMLYRMTTFTSFGHFITLKGPVHPFPSFWLAFGGYQRQAKLPGENSVSLAVRS